MICYYTAWNSILRNRSFAWYLFLGGGLKRRLVYPPTWNELRNLYWNKSEHLKPVAGQDVNDLKMTHRKHKNSDFAVRQRKITLFLLCRQAFTFLVSISIRLRSGDAKISRKYNNDFYETMSSKKRQLGQLWCLLVFFGHNLMIEKKSK